MDRMGDSTWQVTASLAVTFVSLLIQGAGEAGGLQGAKPASARKEHTMKAPEDAAQMGCLRTRVPPGHRCKSKTDHGVLLGRFLLPLHFLLMTHTMYSNSQARWCKGSVVQSGHQRSRTWGLESIGINGCHRGRS